ncbi:uncharacterized protein [Epargyreus clarus]|uniref:uncharacterized protein isoform X2 n=1 Tax=Epargyreus clarus TaxID=520877 RepID=UPI003C2E2E27
MVQYQVVDMQAVNEIISILEKFNITKELLETTRLGKHVNELRRKTTDPTLARRAKVLVKRWRDLVIPSVASPGHTGSNRSSAERQVRRLGGTPLTSPALSRQVVSPAVNSPRPPSRPAWGGYESDSQDVILVDDDPPAPPPPAPLKPVTPPVKRPPSPEPLHDDKKAKRDKKPKKRRGHSRAGTGTETPAGAVGAVGVGGAAGAWGARNGAAAGERRNGWRRDAADPYTALAHRLPPAGAKKVKTTKELLEQIQSRGSKTATSRPPSPGSPASPDVMLIEPDPSPVKVESPMRNGSSEPPAPSIFPLEDEREYPECTCEHDEAQAECPAAHRLAVEPLHVQLLHHALLPGVNGTRAPPHPHPYAVRRAAHPDRDGLFAAVVPLYKYSDYSDDACVKNLARVPLGLDLPWTEFAPPPPSPPPPPPTPPPRPYPLEDPPPPPPEPADDDDPGSPPDARPEPPASPAPDPGAAAARDDGPRIEAEAVRIAPLEPSERLKAPLLDAEEEAQFEARASPAADAPPAREFALEPSSHRTVERTKADIDGRALLAACDAALRAAPCSYAQAAAAPVLALAEAARGEAALRAALAPAAAEARDALGRPPRPALFAEWHECARLGELLALPYVVID